MKFFTHALKSLPLLVAILVVALNGGLRGQTIFNDDFNGTDVTTNDGPGAVNPSVSVEAYSTGSSSGTAPASQDGSGASFTPSGYYGLSYLSSLTGNSGTSYALGSTPTQFNITSNNVNVAQDNSIGAVEYIGGPTTDAGFRWEYGIVSAGTTAGANNDLYDNVTGGLYVSLYYDQSGLISGALRSVNSDHAAQTDSGSGTSSLALFTLSSSSVNGDYASPLTVSFDLTSTGYAVTFNHAVSVSSGSLTSAYGNNVSGFQDGVRMNLVGQNWGDGIGSGDITDVDIQTIPEPGVTYLLIAGFAFGFWHLRRRGASMI